jgi:hypothetical protein
MLDFQFAGVAFFLEQETEAAEKTFPIRCGLIGEDHIVKEQKL